MFTKHSPLPAILFGSFLVFAFAGCQKLKDYLYTHGDADYKTCNIKKVVGIYGKDTTIYNITYNAAGNPVTVINNHVFTGNYNYAFYYDNRNRLVRLVKPYTNGLYDEWLEYEYNSKNQIAKASSYSFGELVGNTPQPSIYHSFLYFDYDAKNRLSHVKQDVIIDGAVNRSFDTNYNYDANGNLIDGSTYDNKLNAARTNTIWMFITRNYSVNNPFVASQYNSNNLPTRCSRLFLVHTGAVDISVDYWCK